MKDSGRETVDMKGAFLFSEDFHTPRKTLRQSAQQGLSVFENTMYNKSRVDAGASERYNK